MSKKEERTRNSRALAGPDSSRSPIIGCDSEYITAALGLQEEIKEKFTPKRKRLETVADLYGAVAERVRAPGPEGDVFEHPMIEYVKVAGVGKAYELMSRYGPDKILDAAACACYDWYRKHSENVGDCGTLLEFHVSPDRAALHHANFCRDRLCPLCNWRRSLKIFGQISRVMDVMEHENYRYLFLTLTVRNVWGDELTDAVQALYDGWRVLYNQYMRGPIRTAEKRLKGIVKGTFRVLEVTVSEGEYSPGWRGSFHPHLHVILAVDPSYFKRGHYLDRAEWGDIWRKACGLNYSPSVKIEAVRPKALDEAPFEKLSKSKAAPDEAGMTISYAGAVAELSKYPMKDADYSRDADFGEDKGRYLSWVIHALRGRRLVGMTGRFKEIAHELALDDMEEGDLIHVGPDELRVDLNYLVVKYHWRCGAYEPFVYRPKADEDAESGVALEEISPDTDVSGRAALADTERKERRKTEKRREWAARRRNKKRLADEKGGGDDGATS